MTNCKDKCWCRKLKIKSPDGDAPPLMQDLFSMAHKIEHLYDGIEKCFERIELIDMAILPAGRIEDFVKQNVDKIHERIDQLETNTDFEQAKLLIYHGAETHATILQIQAQLKALTEMYKALSINVAGLQDHHIRQIDENRKTSKRVDEVEQLVYDEKEKFRCNDRKPHKCPVCKGLGNPDITDRTAYGPRRHMIENDPCNSCKGTGIMWG